MTASLIDGKEVAALKKVELKNKVSDYVAKRHRAPCLAVILIGSDPASSIYVNKKKGACSEVGITSISYTLPEETTESALLKLILELNNQDDVDGILIQLPLPQQFNTAFILEQINPLKDVDGFHPYNLGRLAQKNPLLRPCTPKGIISLLQHYQLPIKGQHAVVIGASNIVGRPMGLELLLAGATVTLCHRFTNNLNSLVSIADLIVVATGVMDLVQPDWLMDHQIVIDVGIHRLPNGSIRGDIDFSTAQKKVSWISPVPGGVGPMTIVSLLENTLIAANRDNKS
jgi:methylenetetrahydrofolate dehydrogenase (NADP+)/methenyltetrahydrofolate cyclohydrolase